MRVVPQDRQSLFDLCIQYTGTIESLFAIMTANGFLSLTPDMSDGVEIDTTAAKRSKDFYILNSITVATAPLLEISRDFDSTDFNPNDFN